MFIADCLQQFSINLQDKVCIRHFSLAEVTKGKGKEAYSS